VKRWLAAHGVVVTRVVNGLEHARRFGTGSVPSKRPHAFGIDLHVDDSPGVEEEGRRHGFQVVVVHPTAEDWSRPVREAVRAGLERPIHF
jgi:hypothetical protein